MELVEVIKKRRSISKYKPDKIPIANFEILMLYCIL